MAKLTLYSTPACPYCQKVLKFMRSAGMDLPLKNTMDDKICQELLALGGKTQVPCLVIDGTALYESDDIIDWLKENFVKHDTRSN